MNSNFHIGQLVIATPKDGDFNNQFEGIVVGFRNNHVCVEDEDENVFDCDPDQLN